MNMETPEMEQVTQQMRDLMRQWVERPGDKALKARYLALQERYQRMYLELTQGGEQARA